MANHKFSQIPRAQIPRSSFDRSFNHKTTFDEGLLIPIFCQEILPGDSLNCNLSAVVRLLSPTSAPMMDDLFFDFQFFFVPNRLVWEHWQAFNGEQANPGDSTDYLVPSIQFPAYKSSQGGSFDFFSYVPWLACLPFSGSIFDYFGIPAFQNAFGTIPDTSTVPELDLSKLTDVTSIQVNALPFRAYNLIWNEWYRDENLQDRAVQITGDGPDVNYGGTSDGDCFNLPSVPFSGDALGDAGPLYFLLPRGKRHDYFTSCLPWPQKGPGVEISIGGTVPIFGTEASIPIYGTGYSLGLTTSTSASGSSAVVSTDRYAGSYESAGVFMSSNSLGLPVGSAGSLASDPDTTLGVSLVTESQLDGRDYRYTGIAGDYSGLSVDLSQATPITINDLRQAFQLQRLYERDARGGTRYTEILRSHFGVVSPDARLQRPEYLGGFSEPLNATNVAQTSATTDDGALGDLSSYMVSGFSKHGFVRSFVEHGFVIGLASVRARLTYWQGVNRMWSRKTRFDYYWPALAHLGEQAVLNKEIFLQDNSARTHDGYDTPINDEVFGYQERWSEYRYAPNVLSGLMRPYSYSADVSGYGNLGSSVLSSIPFWRYHQVSGLGSYKTGNDVFSTASLSWWNLSQVLGDFTSDGATPPALNALFISENPPVDRVVSVPSQHHFIGDFQFKLKHARVMPTYSVPGLIDHF